MLFWLMRRLTSKVPRVLWILLSLFCEVHRLISVNLLYINTYSNFLKVSINFNLHNPYRFNEPDKYERAVRKVFMMGSNGNKVFFVCVCCTKSISLISESIPIGPYICIIISVFISSIFSVSVCVKWCRAMCYSRQMHECTYVRSQIINSVRDFWNVGYECRYLWLMTIVFDQSFFCSLFSLIF